MLWGAISFPPQLSGKLYLMAKLRQGEKKFKAQQTAQSLYNYLFIASKEECWLGGKMTACKHLQGLQAENIGGSEQQEVNSTDRFIGGFESCMIGVMALS